MPSHLPKIQKVEQHKPIDLSGQSNKVLEIKSTLAAVKSPISSSGIFTKTHDTLIKMEKHLSKLRDFAAAKTDVKWNKKTGQYHATLDSNKMVPFSDTRVPEGATRVEPKLDTFAAMGKEGTGNGEMLDELKQINENTRGLIKSGKSNAEDAMEEEAYKENQDFELAKREKERSMTLKGMWDSIKEGNKDNWFVKNWKMIAAGLFVLLTPLKHLKKVFDVLVKAFKWSAKHPLIAAITGLTLWFTKGPLLKLLGGWASKGAGMAWGAAKGGITKFMENRKAMSIMKEQGLKTRGGPGLLSRTGGAIKTGAVRAVEGAKAAGGKAVQGLKGAGGAVKKGAGNIASASKGIFGSIVQKFGKAGKWIKKLGSKLIMPLVTTPVGWAILAGLAIGGLVYAFWDDIKAGLSKAFGFLTGAVDSLKEKFAAINIGSWMKALIGTLPDYISKPLLSLLGGDDEEPEVPTVTDEQVEKQDAIMTNRKAKGKFATKAEFLQSEEYKSQIRKPDGTLKGINTTKQDKMWQAHLGGVDDEVETGSGTSKAAKEASQRAAERTLGKYQEGKRGSERAVELALKGPSGKHLWSKMNEKEKKKFKFAAQIAGIIPKTTNIVSNSPDDNLSASVSPSSKSAGMRALHTENATLKGEQAGVGNFVNAPSTNVTNNNNETKFLMPKNAQGGMNLDKLVE